MSRSKGSKLVKAPQWMTVLMRPEHVMSDMVSKYLVWLLIIWHFIKMIFNQFSVHS